ncbi:MAG: hypothetical protein MUO89_09665 [Dehalococcoidia bacterium]|nr:hypothetical protein [Dehalococcoidia bacterium]
MKKSGILFFILIVISSLLATSCVTRQVPVVETYSETEYKTEYRTEPYTETVDAVISSKQGVSYPNVKSKWYTDLLIPGFSGSGGTYYFDYTIESSHTKNQIEINISQVAQEASGMVRVYDLSSTGPIPPRPTPFKDYWMQPSEINWLNNLNAVLGSARLLGEVQLGSGGGSQILFDANGVREFGILATTWNAYAIKSVKLLWTDEVTGTKTVTGERQVPYQVPYQVEKQRTVYQTETVPFWDAIFGK